jgi:hypothetical protein
VLYFIERIVNLNYCDTVGHLAAGIFDSNAAATMPTGLAQNPAPARLRLAGEERLFSW